MRNRPVLAYPPSASTVAGHPRPGWRTVPAAARVADDIAVAPIVSFEDPDPVLDTGTGCGQHGSKPSRRPRSVLAAALVLCGTLALLLLAVLLGAPPHAPAGATAGRPAGQQPGHELPQGAMRPLSRPGPINLPDPIGTVPRAIPLDTIWLVDAALPAPDLAELSSEAPVDVAYLAEHALPGDELGFALSRAAQQAVLAGQPQLEEMAGHPASLTVAAPREPVRLPPVTRRHDRAIVVITADPRAWLNVLPAGPTPPAPTAASRPGRTWIYILDLSTGSGSPADPLTPSLVQPEQLTADPSVRGSIARALARAFVAATGAGWPG